MAQSGLSVTVRATLAALPLAAGIAGAVCWVPQGNPASSTEGPGCTASTLPTPCSTYQSCPTGDTCVTNGCGWTACVPNGTVNLPCHSYSGGVLNPVTLCCEAGTLVTNNNGVLAAVALLKGNGTKCGGCMPEGGGEF